MRIAGLVIVILAINGALWLLLGYLFRRRYARLKETLYTELLATGETPLIGPEWANYIGALHTYDKTKGGGVICLTPKRLIFRKLTGSKIEILRSKITGADSRASRSSTELSSSKQIEQRRKMSIYTDDGNRIQIRVGNIGFWLKSLN